MVLLCILTRADPIWPSPNDELEEIMYQVEGYRARDFGGTVIPCSNEASGPGRQNAAEWLRAAFHDMATTTYLSGIRAGGLDGSLQYELTSSDNIGPGFNTTLKFMADYYTSRSSVADLIALGVYYAVRSCGGPVVPVAGGRVDALAAGPIGVPLPQNTAFTFEQQFTRMGFSKTEMIQATACGHSIGGVHEKEFPEIVPVGSTLNGEAPLDSTVAAFDNKVVAEYIAGNTTNPLVVGPSIKATRNADYKVFNYDSNVTVKAMAGVAEFNSICTTVLQKLIDTVPDGVVLSDPIQPYSVKPVDMQLSLNSDPSTMQLTGLIRVRTTDIGEDSVSSLTLNYKDRSGSTNCGSTNCAYTATLLGSTQGFDDQFIWFPINTSILTSTGISSFTITLNMADGTTKTYDNNGNTYPMQDTIFIQNPQSCLLSGTLTITASVRNDRKSLPVKLFVSYKTSTGDPNRPVPTLKNATITMTEGTCVGSYTFYTADFTGLGDLAYASKIDVISGSDSSSVVDDFNAASELEATCKPFQTPPTSACTTGQLSTSPGSPTTSSTSVSLSTTSSTTVSTTSTSSTAPAETLHHRQDIGEDTSSTNPTSPDILSEIAGEVRKYEQRPTYVKLSSTSPRYGFLQYALSYDRLNLLGGVKPVNNLNGNKQNPSRSVQSSPIRRPSDSSPAPPPKRQKVEEYNVHTQAQFVVVFDHDGTADRPNPRKRSLDNRSESQHTFISQSSTKGAPSTEAKIPEFRSTESYVRPLHKNRPRHNTPKQHVGQLDREVATETPLLKSDIEDSDGDVEIIGAEVMVTPQTRHTQGVRYSIEDFGRRFKTTSGAQKMEEIIDSTMLKEDGSNNPVSSPDELAPETQDMREKMPTKRPTLSPSLSKKGDIPRTKFTPPSRTRLQGPRRGLSESDRVTKIVNSPLRVLRAVSGGHKYEGENSDGQLMKEYAYLTVNLKKVKQIRTSSQPNCLVALIQRAIDGSISGGQSLWIEFSSPKDLKKFVTWARDTGSDGLVDESSPWGRLEKELENTIRTATNRTVIRDDVLRGDDMRLIEHNLANTNQARAGNLPRIPVPQGKLKDTMRPHSASSLDPKTTVISDNPRPYSLRRQPHKTHSTFALKGPSSESESPEPECWTTQHIGWERDWRNSLVFPFHGKSRATVDKEDIPRLDEGQFLNDNLIIFYLRYLQHTLEAERPDLAQRIYFQNTYFYEKLKSTRTAQGINYDSVKAWTSKVDLFTKDYIIVPINEFTHWYVAIIYNAPKLLSSPGKTENTAKDTIIIEEDINDSREASREVSSASPDNGKSADKPRSLEAVRSELQSDVTNHFSRMSIESPGFPNGIAKQTIAPEPENQKTDAQLTSCKQEATDVRHDNIKGDVRHIVSSNDNLQRKKTTKGYGTGTRRHSPDQLKIITLDSLGLAHSPACSCLKQYLIAELKDKKGIEIPNPGALGMTAKEVPQQTNHCDCGLYLLGYIREFLKDPDGFVRNILLHNHIAWDLNPSELRNNIRDLIFDLQKEQQRREDIHREEKRNKAGLLKRKVRGSIDERPLKQLAKEQDISRGASEPQKDEDIPKENSVAKPKPKSPTPEVSLETRPVSNSENRPIPGSFPRSPAVASANISALNVSNPEQAKVPKFVSPLPESPCGSSPESPVVVEDPEVPQGQGRSANHIHSDLKRANLSEEEPVREVQKTYQNQDRPAGQSRDQEEMITVSHYFAGRQPGDKMVSAKLREEPLHSDVIDISD
ncbi:Ubiquitin-like-specific protease 2 [Daldinia childiae]|uniref:Ubiquitin-like-specific protease 2 n=1 Tax=Daldinia childiae TaxID=326645 RepID=UPI001447AEBC|nr:Ubiquitin-like-specific protease 2 [Daldinia childiae]KAF3065112.1 Ubiquitin-like-specific protease 2 [Daldinia childiae]